MKQNYQAELEKLILSLPQDKKPSLLLHSCCGPCSTHVLNFLRSHFNITVFFYNPSIMPESEYELRLKTQLEVIEHFSATNPIKIISYPYDPSEFLSLARGLENEPERGKRCDLCMEQRIKKTAAYASENQYDFFCTTLSVSPHKDPELLNTLSSHYSKIYAIPYLPADFKKKGGFQESIRLSKELSLYRQAYCGCIFSKKQSDE